MYCPPENLPETSLPIIVVSVVLPLKLLVSFAMFFGGIALDLLAFIVVLLVNLALFFLIARVSGIAAIIPIEHLLSLMFLPVQPVHPLVVLVLLFFVMFFVLARQVAMLFRVGAGVVVRIIIRSRGTTIIWSRSTAIIWIGGPTIVGIVRFVRRVSIVTAPSHGCTPSSQQHRADC